MDESTIIQIPPNPQTKISEIVDLLQKGVDIYAGLARKSEVRTSAHRKKQLVTTRV